MTVPSRRERLRTATVTEIKDGARRLLVTGGPQAVSLRAIARDMGMSAPALYRYFPSLEALIAAVAGDCYDELRARIEAARDASGGDPPTKLVDMTRAFRRWSVEHPAEFALIFGTPVPALAGFEQDYDADHPGTRFGAVFMESFAEMWRWRQFRVPPAELIDPRLRHCLGPLHEHTRDLPDEAAFVYLSAWTRLYGLVSMEVFHHLNWALSDPEALFETELRVFVHQLYADRAPDEGTAGDGDAG